MFALCCDRMHPIMALITNSNTKTTVYTVEPLAKPQEMESWQ